MTDQNTDALRCADEIDEEFAKGRISNYNGRKAAAHIRRLVAENEALQKAMMSSADVKEAMRLTSVYATARSARTQVVRANKGKASPISLPQADARVDRAKTALYQHLSKFRKD